MANYVLEATGKTEKNTLKNLDDKIKMYNAKLGKKDLPLLLDPKSRQYTLFCEVVEVDPQATASPGTGTYSSVKGFDDARRVAKRAFGSDAKFRTKQYSISEVYRITDEQIEALRVKKPPGAAPMAVTQRSRGSSITDLL